MEYRQIEKRDGEKALSHTKKKKVEEYAFIFP